LLQISLGTYDTEVEAARAYDKKALAHFGPETYTNVSWAAAILRLLLGSL
jgi:hypothetical protein